MGTGVQKTPTVAYELGRLPVASNRDAVRTLLTVIFPAHAALPWIDVLVWLNVVRSEPLNLMWLARPAEAILNIPRTDNAPRHATQVKLRGCAKLAPV